MQPPVFDTPEAAEAAFYRAFGMNDIDAMMAVWAPDEEITLIPPMSGPMGGRDAVRRSWEAIFRFFPQMVFRVDTARAIVGKDLVVRVVYEYIGVGELEQPQAPVMATNVYRYAEDGWRLILHHASPTPGAAPPFMH